MSETEKDWQLRRIGVIGAGAMGSSLASFLGGSLPVVMVCRDGNRAAEILRNGVRTHGAIESEAAPIVVRRVSDLARVGGVSALFVATKTTAIPEVAKELRPLLGHIADQPSGLYVVSYQNGIEPGRYLMNLLGDQRVLRMVLSLGARMEADRRSVKITFNSPPHAIGAPGPGNAEASRQIASVLTEAGLGTQYDEQIELRVWEKAVINAAANPVAALVNSSVGELYRSPARSIVDRLLEEGAAVARTEGMALDESYLVRAHRAMESAYDHIPSMVEDVRAGRQSEIGQLNQQIIKHARRVGVPVPTHEIVDALIETFDWKVYHKSEDGSRRV